MPRGALQMIIDIDADGLSKCLHSLFYRYTLFGRSTNTDNYDSQQTLKYDRFICSNGIFFFLSFGRTISG